MSFHRERQPWKGRTQQIYLRGAEAPRAVGRERIEDARPVRRIVCLSKLKCETHIICRAGRMEICESGKVPMLWAEFESAPQPRVLFASARTLDKRMEGAAQPLLRNRTARKLLLTNRI